MTPPDESRQRLALGSPDRDLAAFPRKTYRTGSVFYRLHRTRNGPWWFSSDMSGRFDLPPEVGGTCYLARTVATALREGFGPLLTRAVVLPIDELDSRSVSRLKLPRKARAADTATAAAAPFGITREISAATSYDLPQLWALRLRQVGFDAVSYEGRFDPSRQAECLALFADRAGEGSSADYAPDPQPWPATVVASEIGIRFEPPPPRAALTVIDPP